MAKFRNWSRVQNFANNLTFLPSVDFKKLEIWQNLRNWSRVQNFAKI